MEICGEVAHNGGDDEEMRDYGSDDRGHSGGYLP
jgi:hypothetical protein